MPIGRILLKSISESKKLSILKSDGARLLYTWLLPHLDINGCHSGDSMVIKGKIFTRLIKSIKIIEGYLQDLESAGLIIRYEVNGDIFLNYPDFVEKQPKLNPEREGKITITPPTQEQLMIKSGVNQDKLPHKLNKIKSSENLNEDIVLQIITHLNEKAKTNYSPKTKITTEYINGRIADGFKLNDFIYVIDVKCEDWIGDLEMEKFLRPKTLFATSNFEGYLNQKRGRKVNHGVGGQGDNKKISALFEKQKREGDFDGLDDKEE